MKIETVKVRNQTGENWGSCPLPLEIIPNKMGINLCSVDSVMWQKQDDGQLTSLTIYFIPAEKKDE